MAENETSYYFSIERLTEHGEEGYDHYKTVAQSSSIPPFFADVAKAYLFNLPEMRGMSIMDKARLLFNSEFNTDRDAWFAINYAQAIAVVKKEADEEDAMDAASMLVGVGVAVMLEPKKDQQLEALKRRVEDIFADPREGLRLAKMHEDVKLRPQVN